MKMRKMSASLKASIAGAVLGLGFIGAPTDGRADLVLVGGTPQNSFVDIGAQGFGAAPRLLTLQDNGVEAGQIVVQPGGTLASATFAGQNDVANPQPPSQKNDAPLLSFVGWQTGADVKIGFNSDQTGFGAINLNQLVLNVYNGSTVVGSFSLADDVHFSTADLQLQQGNGNAIFEFVLNGAQQTIWDNSNFLSSYRIALAAELGQPIVTVGGTILGPSNDGPESFLAVRTATAIPGPIAGAGLPSIIAACGAILALARRRRQKVV
jgi:hypothetical protein